MQPKPYLTSGREHQANQHNLFLPESTLNPPDFRQRSFIWALFNYSTYRKEDGDCIIRCH